MYLRKHVATMCQLFNLNENELKQMADFMCHTFDIHLSHYRMPEQTTQIINISRFLSVVGDKNVYRYRGKTWEELQSFGTPEGGNDENEDDDNNEDDNEEETNNPETNFDEEYTLPPPVSFGSDKDALPLPPTSRDAPIRQFR